MVSAINTSLIGLDNASRKIAESSEKISKFGTDIEGGDQVDLSEEAVNLISAEVEYKANLKAIEAQNELTEELLNSFDEKV